MKAARIQVIIGFFLTVSIIVTYKVISTERMDPALKQAQIAYESERLQLEREQLRHYHELETQRYKVKQATLRRANDLNFYGALGLFSAVGLSLIIVAIGHNRARMKHASVHIARIGQHSEIPIHQKDLQSFYPIAVNLSLAEIEASTSDAHDKAYRISRQMIADITDYTRAIAGKRGMLALEHDQQESNFIDIAVPNATLTFAELLRNGMIAPGKPLILGYDRQGQPQYRTLYDLKSLAVAGWQGSGKTLSTGYIVASSVLAYGVHAYIVDPHKYHPESLYSLIKPLEQTGHITVINPFDTPVLLDELNGILDRRLSGEAPSDPAILLVIDEMARLAKMECFDVLITFLERCTEETRKANMTFIGGSNKWTARHFKGRADIRGCMNSMLVHKTKPSQADLLLEDAQDKNLVKQLHQPGEAIVVTDYDTPILVTMPLCTRDDMNTVAQRMRQSSQIAQADVPQTSMPSGQRPLTESAVPVESLLPQLSEEPVSPLVVEDQPAPVDNTHQSPSYPEGRHTAPRVVSLEEHRQKRQKIGGPAQEAWRHLTLKKLQDQWRCLKTQYPKLTQTEIARQAGLSPGHFSRLLRGKSPLKSKYKQKLYKALFRNDEIGMHAIHH